MLNTDSEDLSSYGEKSLSTLTAHCGTEKAAETLQGEAIVREAILSPDISTEWKTFRRYMSKQPQDNMKMQLKELVSNNMLKTMFPNLPPSVCLYMTLCACCHSLRREQLFSDEVNENSFTKQLE